jgi:hypothetical protein
VLLAAVAAVVVVWVLPWYVRREVIREAAAHGIALEVDDAKIDTAGFRLVGVRATVADVPDARAQAPEIEVETRDLRPARMTVHRAELAMKGRWSAVDAALAKWRAGRSGEQGTAWMPSTLVVDESRVVWQSPTGDDARLDAANVHLEVTWQSATSEVHARSDKVTLAVPRATLGPWRLDFDRLPARAGAAAGSSRVRLALDPGAPDASSVLVVGDDERTTSVDVAVPRSPLARLGIPPELLGLRGKSPQVQLDAHYATLGPQRAHVTAKGGLYAIDAGLPRPLDVTWEASATGDARAGLDLKDGRLTAGPLAGTLAGKLETFDDGFRVNLAWSAAPVPCSAFEAPPSGGPEEPFDIGNQLRMLAEATGITKVKGDVSARGALSFDSRDPAAARVEFTPDVQCQVALFAP